MPDAEKLFQGMVELVVDRNESVADFGAELIIHEHTAALRSRPEIAEIVQMVAKSATLSVVAALIEADQLPVNFDTDATKKALQRRSSLVQNSMSGGSI